MSDNVTLNLGSGGAVIATDDVGGAQHQYVKVEFGGDGTATPVTAADPLPVTAVVTGTVAATQSGTWTVQPGNTANTTAWLVTGTGGTFPVTGTFWQATQPVSLASVPSHDVTNAGTFAVQAAQSGTWNITNVSGTISLPTGAATLAEQQTQTTALQLIDDTVYTDGTGTPSKALGIAGTDGTNPQIVKVDSNGELQVDVLSMPTTTVTATNLDVRDLTSASDSVAAVQSGTWNITDISGTVSLPTGAATAAKQPALGTAGTASADVITVQGIASMTALKVDGSAVAQPVTDNSGSLTVDAPVGTPVFVRLSDGSSAISALPVTDNGGSLTVDGTVGVTNTPLTNFGAGEYETVAASQTAQVLGTTGGAGDYIAGVLVIPATTSPGNVILLDNATSITIFTGGASSVSNLVPFFIPLGMISVSGAWKLTTGTNVSCIGIGNFT